MQRIVLRRRPEGLVTWDDVELVAAPVPVPGSLEALLRNEVPGHPRRVGALWLSPARGAACRPVEIRADGAALTRVGPDASSLLDFAAL